jgi:cGMP-dependent protein kinase
MEKKKILFKENDDGNFFYLIKSGSLSLQVKGEVIKIFEDWDYFGELALIQKCKRSGTVKCLTDSEIFVLDGKIYREKIKSFNSQILKDKLFFINRIPMISCLDNIKKINLARLINLVEFKKDQKIIKEGDSGDRMYIIKEGIVTCKKGNNEIRKLYEKDFFGHNSIIVQCKRSLDVIAINNVICYEFSLNTLKIALGINFKDVILFAIFREAIINNSFFSEIFNENIFEKMFEIFEMKIYKNNDVIYEKNSKINNKKIVILLEGNMVDVNFLKFLYKGILSKKISNFFLMI